MKIVILCVTGCAVMVLAGVSSIWIRLANGSSSCAVGSDVANKSVSCSEGWFPFGDRCFHYVTNKTTWAESELKCRSMGANLASVHSMQEYQEIQRQTNVQEETWIGGFLAADVWLWTDGSIFQYSNWCSGEPNNDGGSQECMRINFGDDKCWDDYDCKFIYPSVCAKAGTI